MTEDDEFCMKLIQELADDTERKLARRDYWLRGEVCLVRDDEGVLHYVPPAVMERILERRALKKLN